MSLHDDTAEIDRLLTDRLEEVLDRYWPGWVYGQGKRSAFPEPKSAADKGSFEVYLAPYGRQRRGDWFRRSQGIGGRPIQLIAYALAGDHKAYRGAFAEARDFLGLQRVGKALSKEEKVEQAKTREIAQRASEEHREHEADLANVRRAYFSELARAIWGGAKPIKGTPAETYLRGRGIDFHLDFPSLRFCKPPVVQSRPFLVCAVVGPDLKMTGIWRILLEQVGDSVIKARVENPKLGLGPAAGGAVWLGKPGESILVCEGVETGLGIWGLTEGETPVAATLSTSGMSSFIPPACVKRVLIFPDGDTDRIKLRSDKLQIQSSPGLKAALALAKRLTEEGRVSVAIQPTPKNGRDWLDHWNNREKLNGSTPENAPIEG